MAEPAAPTTPATPEAPTSAPSTLLGTQQQPTTPTTPTTPVAPATGNDFLVEGKFASGISGRLPDDLKPYAGSIQKFEGAPLTDVLKSYGELERKLGARVQPPGPEAKAEEIAAWRKVTGAPEKPEGYNIKRPDDIPAEAWSDDLANGFAAMAHKHHLSPAAANEIVGWWNEQQKAAMGQGQQQAAQSREELAGALQKDWGEKFQQNLHAAQRVASIAKLDVNDPAIGDNPAVIRALHAMSALISEDRQVTGGSNGPSLSLQQQADDIQTNPANPFHADYQGKNGEERQRQAADKVRKLRMAGA